LALLAREPFAVCDSSAGERLFISLTTATEPSIVFHAGFGADSAVIVEPLVSGRGSLISRHGSNLLELRTEANAAPSWTVEGPGPIFGRPRSFAHSRQEFVVATWQIDAGFAVTVHDDESGSLIWSREFEEIPESVRVSGTQGEGSEELVVIGVERMLSPGSHRTGIEVFFRVFGILTDRELYSFAAPEPERLTAPREGGNDRLLGLATTLQGSTYAAVLYDVPGAREDAPTLLRFQRY
jgi:hypothetical protein